MGCSQKVSPQPAMRGSAAQGLVSGSDARPDRARRVTTGCHRARPACAGRPQPPTSETGTRPPPTGTRGTVERKVTSGRGAISGEIPERSPEHPTDRSRREIVVRAVLSSLVGGEQVQGELGGEVVPPGCSVRTRRRGVVAQADLLAELGDDRACGRRSNPTPAGWTCPVSCSARRRWGCSDDGGLFEVGWRCSAVPSHIHVCLR